MKTREVQNPTVEKDILTIIREMETVSKDEVETSGVQTLPDPKDLLSSLQKKQALINLIEGYVDRPDMRDMKTRLNEAIVDLEKIIRGETA